MWPTQQLATRHFISAITLQREKTVQSLSQGRLRKSSVSESRVSASGGVSQSKTAPGTALRVSSG